MPRKISLTQFADALAEAKAAMPGAIRDALMVTGVAAEKIAKEKIGHYQQSVEGPGISFPAWSPLAAATIAEKMRLGYAPPDNPLLRRGDLRDSISHQVIRNTLRLGSDDPIAAYQSFGTSSIPPRPVFGPAMIETIPTFNRAIRAALRQVFSATENAPIHLPMAAE